MLKHADDINRSSQFERILHNLCFHVNLRAQLKVVPPEMLKIKKF